MFTKSPEKFRPKQQHEQQQQVWSLAVSRASTATTTTNEI
jgi:hypothetical protein